MDIEKGIDVPDVNLDSTQRGGAFTADQNNVLDTMVRFVKAQNPFAQFSYVNAVTAIPEDAWLDCGGVAVTQDVMGWIPLRNGFISGYGIATNVHLDPTDAIKFVVYRDGAESGCRFYLTAQDNSTNLSTGNAGGCRRARVFNTSPGVYNTVEPQNSIYPFKAQEKIALRAAASELPGHTFPVNINNLEVFLYYEFSVETPESDKSRNLGGGSTSAGGGGATGEGGEGGGGGIIILT